MDEIVAHISVVREFARDWHGYRFRVECSVCPFSAHEHTEDDAYGAADIHYDYEAGRARLGLHAGVAIA